MAAKVLYHVNGTMPTKRIENSKPATSTVIERVLAKNGTDALADDLADKLAEKLLASINVDSLVDALHAKHTAEFQEAITTAIIERL